MADNQLTPISDIKKTGIVQQMANTNGVLDAKGLGAFATNMGGKPYIQKAGLSIKLNQFANKHKGIKSVISIPISYSTEDPKQMKELFSLLPDQTKAEVLRNRDNDMAMFTTPLGTAMAKCIIIFGDGLRASETATANTGNVKMSTIHAFLDVMAATRAYNRCVKKLTGDGFMSVDLVEEFDNYDDVDFIPVQEDSFRDAAGAAENTDMGQGMEYETDGATAGSCMAAPTGGETIIPEPVPDPKEETAYITKTQQKKMFMLGSTEKVKAVLGKHGYKGSALVPKSEYADICKEIEEEEPQYE